MWLASKAFGFDASFDNHMFIPRNSVLLKGASKRALHRVAFDSERAAQQGRHGIGRKEIKRKFYLD